VDAQAPNEWGPQCRLSVVAVDKTAILQQSPDLSNSDQHRDLYWTILQCMARRVSSDGDRGNGARIWALRAGDSPRVAPAAGLRGERRNGGAATDHVVEERGLVEAALAFAASIVESSDDAIIGMTLHGMVTSWNAGAERLYGYTACEVIGRWPIAITFPGDEQPKILKRVGRGERVNHYETVGVRKDGQRIKVCVTVSPIQDAGGKIIGALSIARDITHRQEAEASIPDRDTLRYVASLAAAAAHEINNPLMVIIGNAELLADKVGTQGRGQIDEILKALSRIQEIVMRMERVTRIELAEEAPYLPEMLDLIRSSEPGFPPR
jgi:PAS domain S-box-containing protein